MADMPEDFPPQIIADWIKGKTVSTDPLVLSLRAWADYFGQHECTGDPCICTNGIGCTAVPLDRW